MRGATSTAMIAIVLTITSFAYAARVSGTFNEDLILMGNQARKDSEISVPGEEQTKAQRALYLIGVLQKVERGERFIIDTEDQYIGAIIQLYGGRTTRRPFDTRKDQVILIEYHQKAKLLAGFRVSFVKGNWSEAANVAANLSEKYPKYGPTWTSLGLIKAVNGDYDGAEASFTRANALTRDPQVYHAAALTYLAQGKELQARREIEKALAIDPGLNGLSEEGPQYFKVNKPEAWAAYRVRVEGIVGRQVIERAFGGAGPESEIKPKNMDVGPSGEGREKIEKAIRKGLEKGTTPPSTK